MSQDGPPVDGPDAAVSVMCELRRLTYPADALPKIKRAEDAYFDGGTMRDFIEALSRIDARYGDEMIL